MKKVIIVNDKMQKNYRYTLVAPVGKNFDPNFKPDLSPKEMLERGVFGGVYLRDCQKEFPVSWFARAKLQKTDLNKPDPKLNYYKILASQTLLVWRERGWLNEEHDPRGWFQWYCRYYLGRRLLGEDERQIKRWRQMQRHLAQVRKNCRLSDKTCRPKQRQALLHWAYDSDKI